MTPMRAPTPVAPPLWVAHCVPPVPPAAPLPPPAGPRAASDASDGIGAKKSFFASLLSMFGDSKPAAPKIVGEAPKGPRSRKSMDSRKSMEVASTPVLPTKLQQDVLRSFGRTKSQTPSRSALKKSPSTLSMSAAADCEDELFFQPDGVDDDGSGVGETSIKQRASPPDEAMTFLEPAQRVSLQRSSRLSGTHRFSRQYNRLSVPDQLCDLPGQQQQLQHVQSALDLRALGSNDPAGPCNTYSRNVQYTMSDSDYQHYQAGISPELLQATQSEMGNRPSDGRNSGVSREYSTRRRGDVAAGDLAARPPVSQVLGNRPYGRSNTGGSLDPSAPVPPPAPRHSRLASGDANAAFAAGLEPIQIPPGALMADASNSSLAYTTSPSPGYMTSSLYTPSSHTPAAFKATPSFAGGHGDGGVSNDTTPLSYTCSSNKSLMFGGPGGTSPYSSSSGVSSSSNASAALGRRSVCAPPNNPPPPGASPRSSQLAHSSSLLRTQSSATPASIMAAQGYLQPPHVPPSPADFDLPGCLSVDRLSVLQHQHSGPPPDVPGSYSHPGYSLSQQQDYMRQALEQRQSLSQVPEHPSMRQSMAQRQQQELQQQQQRQSLSQQQHEFAHRQSLSLQHQPLPLQQQQQAYEHPIRQSLSLQHQPQQQQPPEHPSMRQSMSHPLESVLQRPIVAQQQPDHTRQHSMARQAEVARQALSLQLEEMQRSMSHQQSLSRQQQQRSTSHQQQTSQSQQPTDLVHQSALEGHIQCVGYNHDDTSNTALTEWERYAAFLQPKEALDAVKERPTHGRRVAPPQVPPSVPPAQGEEMFPATGPSAREQRQAVRQALQKANSNRYMSVDFGDLIQWTHKPPEPLAEPPRAAAPAAPAAGKAQQQQSAFDAARYGRRSLGALEAASRHAHAADGDGYASGSDDMSNESTFMRREIRQRGTSFKDRTGNIEVTEAVRYIGAAAPATESLLKKQPSQVGIRL